MVHETNGERDGTDRVLSRNGVIDLGLLSEIVRSRPAIMMVSIVAGLLLSISYLHMATRKYAVKMEVTASSSTEKDSSGSLSALTSIAGLDLGSGGSSKFRMFMGAIRSPVAAEALAADQDLLKEIFPKEWSAAEGRWREPPGLLHRIEVLLGFAVSPWSPPSANRVYDYLDREFKVTADSKSGVVTMEIDSAKPKVAARILILLNNAIDDLMRSRDLVHASSYIDYLTNRLSTVAVEDYRKPLIYNLTEQEKIRMLASAPLPYVSDLLGKPMISSKPVSPMPILTLGAGFILGGLLGLGLASMAYYRRWNLRIWPNLGSRSAGFPTDEGHKTR